MCCVRIEQYTDTVVITVVARLREATSKEKMSSEEGPTLLDTKDSDNFSKVLLTVKGGSGVVVEPF